MRVESLDLLALIEITRNLRMFNTILKKAIINGNIIISYDPNYNNHLTYILKLLINQ